MKKIIFSITITMFLFMIIFNKPVYSQSQFEMQAFSKLVADSNNPGYQIVVDSHYRDDPKQVYWDASYINNLPLSHFDMETLPNYLSNQTDETNITNQVEYDRTQWNQFGCIQMQYATISTSVYLGFSSRYDIFPNGQMGFTLLAVSQNDSQYVVVPYDQFS